MSVIGLAPVLVMGVAVAVGFGVAAQLVVRGARLPSGRVARMAASADADAVRSVGVPTSGAARPWSDALDRRRLGGMAVASAVVWAVWWGSSAPILGIGACGVLWRVGATVAARRADRRVRGALPDVVESMSAAIRSGAVPTTAFAEAARVAPRAVEADLIRVLGRVDRGEPLDDAVSWWAAERRSRSLGFLAVVLTTSATFGGPLADALDDLALRWRAELRSDDELRAQVAQATASAVMLVCLPAVSAALSAIADPGVLRVLFSTPAGAACLAIGAALDLVGGAWMASLIRGAR